MCALVTGVQTCALPISWLRDPAPTPGMGAPMQGEGLAKPKEEPPVGIDLTRYSKPEKPRGEPLVKPEAIKAGAASLWTRSEEHTSELQSLMRTSYAVFRLKQKTQGQSNHRIRKHRN